MLFLIDISWPIYSLLIPLLAFFIKDWRYLIFFYNVPVIISTFILFYDEKQFF